MSSPLTLLRDRPSPEQPSGQARDESVTSAEERWLCCRSCRARVAPLAAILPSDAPLVFANPSGLVFELVLLREAGGLLFVGPATEEFTWFEGYGWRVALCAGCSTHLGWRFEAVGPAQILREFFGLLRRELVEGGPGRSAD